jgi:hypothetical protein
VYGGLRGLVVGALLLFARGGAASEAAPEAPRIELLTVGPGQAAFTRFGHSALCIVRPSQTEARCVHFGAADFAHPGRLVWEFLRGRARFEADASSRSEAVERYHRRGRTVEVQPLPLTAERAAWLAGRLEAALDPAVRAYRYDHFRDNCATRLRDLVDEASGGRLAEATRAPSGWTARQLARRWSGADPALLIVTELLLGRSADEPLREWRTLFLPERLRDAVQRHLGVAPIGDGAEQAWHAQAPSRGHEAPGTLLLLLLAILSLGGAWLARRRATLRLVALTLLPGLAGVAVWALALVSTVLELVWNENLLVLGPVELVLPVLPARWRLRWLVARSLGIVAVLLLHGAGLLVQPLTPLVLVMPLLLAALAAEVATRRQAA